MKDLLEEVRELVSLIVNSPPETPISGEIESRALYIGHHPFVMNPTLFEEVEREKNKAILHGDAK